jgi:WD40 repeat protein
VALSPDGTKVLTGSADNTAKLWDAATGTVLQTFTVPSLTYLPCRVSSVAFSPDGTKVLTGSDDKTAKLWDATAVTGSLRVTLQPADAIAAGAVWNISSRGEQSRRSE